MLRRCGALQATADDAIVGRSTTGSRVGARMARQIGHRREPARRDLARDAARSRREPVVIEQTALSDVDDSAAIRA